MPKRSVFFKYWFLEVVTQLLLVNFFKRKIFVEIKRSLSRTTLNRENPFATSVQKLEIRLQLLMLGSAKKISQKKWRC
jgi:hypothetical protein